MQTNGIGYFFKGIDAVDDGYMYDKLPDGQKNKFKALRASHAYHGNVDVKDDDSKGRTVIVIDGAIKVSYLHSDFRMNAPKEWGRLQEQSKKTFKATVITGIIAVLAGVAVGIAAAAIPFPPALLVAIPVFLIGVALLIAAGRANRNEKIAARELKKWEDPVSAVCNYRYDVYKSKIKGFADIMRDDVKGKYFHPDEVTSLWRQKDMGDGTDLNKFFKDNPLEDEAMNYAFENVPKHFASLSEFYKIFKKEYEDILAETQAEIKKINDKKEKALRKIEKGQLADPLVEINFGNNGGIKFNPPRTEQEVRDQAQEAIDEVREAEKDKLKTEIQPKVEAIINSFQN